MAGVSLTPVKLHSIWTPLTEPPPLDPCRPYCTPPKERIVSGIGLGLAGDGRKALRFQEGPEAQGTPDQLREIHPGFGPQGPEAALVDKDPAIQGQVGSIQIGGREHVAELEPVNWMSVTVEVDIEPLAVDPSTVSVASSMKVWNSHQARSDSGSP